MELLVVLTMENDAHYRYTDVFTITAPPVQTRADVFRYAITQLPAGFRDRYTVLFFSGEPGQLTGAAG